MTQTNFVKAGIEVLDGTSKGTDFVCLFNPKSYSESKSGGWSSQNAGGNNQPMPGEYQGQAAQLTVSLLFDTYYNSEGSESAQDVRVVYTQPLWQLMLTDSSINKEKSGRARPPLVQFHWGQYRSFAGIITGFKQDFSMFTVQGKPVRAQVDLTITEYGDATVLPSQNPTSGGVGGERYWQVREGDTLGLIAHTQLGNQRRWRDLARANRLENVRTLRPGSWLLIPND